jgi:hypothetical protein
MISISFTYCLQHSQKKRYIASQYANTNIMRAEILDGIKERANVFVNKCVESRGSSMDAYVGSSQYNKAIFLMSLGVFALFCT